MSHSLKRIRDLLNIDPRVTSNRELECCLPDGEGSTDKGYLSATDCAELAEAFAAMAEYLCPPHPKDQKP